MLAVALPFLEARRRRSYDTVCRQGRFQEKNIGGGAGPSSFGRQQRLSEITMEPITSNVEKLGLNNTLKKFFGAWTRFGGPVPPGPNVEPPLFCPTYIYV